MMTPFKMFAIAGVLTATFAGCGASSSGGADSSSGDNAGDGTDSHVSAWDNRVEYTQSADLSEFNITLYANTLGSDYGKPDAIWIGPVREDEYDDKNSFPENEWIDVGSEDTYWLSCKFEYHYASYVDDNSAYICSLQGKKGLDNNESAIQEKYRLEEGVSYVILMMEYDYDGPNGPSVVRTITGPIIAK